MKKIIRLTASILIMTIIFFALTPQTIEAAKGNSIDPMNTALLGNINELRQEKGVEPLVIDEELTKIAEIRAQEASLTWSHIRPDGTHGYDMVEAKQWSGENLAYVKYADFEYTDSELSETADFMYANLAASPAHYDNMIFANFDKIGISTYTVSDENGTKLVTAFMFSD